MRFGIAVPAYGGHADGGRIRALLEAADELGYDSAWFPDHIVVPDDATEVNLSPPFLEPLATCAWALGFTRRLRLGTDVLVAPYRHPLVVSAMTGTIGRLAGDRLVLGVGIGYLRGEFEMLGGVRYEDRAAATDAFLRAQRTPPAGGTVVAPPVPVPLWVGGNGTAGQRRAAELGDGWHPLWMPDGDYARARERIVRRRTESGRDGPFTFSYSCGATRLVDRAPPSWPAPTPRAPAGSEFRYAPEPWVDADGRPRFVGTADQVVADLRRLDAAGVDHVTLRFGTTRVDDLERFAAEVLPAFAR